MQLAINQKSARDDVLDLTKEQLGVVDRKKKELSRMKKVLVRLSKACEENQEDRCPVLEELVIK